MDNSSTIIQQLKTCIEQQDVKGAKKLIADVLSSSFDQYMQGEFIAKVLALYMKESGAHKKSLLSNLDKKLGKLKVLKSASKSLDEDFAVKKLEDKMRSGKEKV